MLRAVQTSFLLFAILLIWPEQGLSQQSTGSVRGRLDLPGGAPRMQVELIELTSGVRMLTATTDTASRFDFYDVPFGSYRVFGRQGLDTTASGIVHVNSVVPVGVVISRDTLMHAIDAASYPALTHTFYPRAMIEKMPALGEARRIENILYNTPGVARGENGRMHIRGEDANILTTIDGFPVANDLTRVHSTLLNANLIKSADLLRGGLNAEYGVSTSGVLALTSQSGIGRQFTGGAYQTLGTFGLSEQGAVLGGGVSQDAGYFAAYNRYSTKRYLEPTSGFETNHTDGSMSTIFGKIDLRLSNSFDLVVLGTYNDGVYSIPNALTEEDSAQDQRVDLFDYMFGARINWKINDFSVLSGLGYTRANAATRLSSGLRNIEDSADNAISLRNNEQFFVGSDRDDQAHGGLLEYSARLNWGDNKHELKIGVGGEVIPLKQSLTVAVTDPNVSNSDSGGGDQRWIAHDPNRNGNPLVINEAVDARRLNAFIQDEVQLSDAFTVGLGVRYDMFKLHEEESAISPRVHAVYKANRDLSFRASYNRLVSQPRLENILVATSQALQHLYTTPTVTFTPIRSEKTNAIELGALWSAGRYIDLDLAVYTKLIEDMLMSTELGSTGIMLPINLAQGRVMGGELLARLKSWNDLSGQISLSVSKAEGIHDGSDPVITGGPAIGTEASYYRNTSTDFRLLTDQAITASWLFSYDNGGGYYFTLGGRFDSGLPFGLSTTSTNEPQFKADLERQGVKAETLDRLELGSEPGVSPRFTLDLGLGLDVRRFLGLPIKISAAAINVLDAKYLTRFSPGFGGAHHGQPRSFVLKLEASS